MNPLIAGFDVETGKAELYFMDYLASMIKVVIDDVLTQLYYLVTRLRMPHTGTGGSSPPPSWTGTSNPT